MIVTVEQAKRKQCRNVPLVLMPKASTIVGKQEMQWTATTCVGTECMAWQWATLGDEQMGEANAGKGFCGFSAR